jgi:hypothetical protein
VQIFNPNPVLPPISARPDQVERALKARFHDAMTQLHPHKKELDLLIVILPDNNGSLYGMKMWFLLHLCSIILSLSLSMRFLFFGIFNR